MYWKNVLLAILMAILPMVYTAITGGHPDFPLDQQSFIALVVWLVGLLVGGWNAGMGWLKYKAEKNIFVVFKDGYEFKKS